MEGKVALEEHFSTELNTPCESQTGTAAPKESS
jgi:hypothetical protein